MKRVILFALVLLLQALPTLAAADPRIQLIPYSGDRVVNLAVASGYAAVVEFSPEEAIDSVVVGNSAVWQISETQRGDRVVVKPLSGAVPTNMIVMTDQRRYVFLLDPSPAGDQSSFVVRFSYSTSPAARQLGALPIATYKLSGNRALFPILMYDDGKHTTIRWANQTPLPAIFSMDGTQEAVINGRMVGSDYVIEGTAGRYRLRYGTAEAVAVRKMLQSRK